MLHHRRHDVFGDPALVEGIGAAAGDGPQRLGIGLVLEQRAGRQRHAGRIEEIGARRRLQVEPADIPGDRCSEPCRNAEAALGKRNCRCEQVCPRLVAGTPVQRFEQPWNAGNPDRAAADHRVVELERLAVVAEEQLRRRRGRRGLARIERGQRPGPGVIPGEKTAAAEPRGLRLHQPEHGLHRNQRIRRIAALAQHREPRICRIGIGRHHHLPLGMHRRLLRNAAGDFRLNRVGSLLRKAEDAMRVASAREARRRFMGCWLSS